MFNSVAHPQIVDLTEVTNWVILEGLRNRLLGKRYLGEWATKYLVGLSNDI